MLSISERPAPGGVLPELLEEPGEVVLLPSVAGFIDEVTPDGDSSGVESSEASWGELHARHG